MPGAGEEVEALLRRGPGGVSLPHKRDELSLGALQIVRRPQVVEASNLRAKQGDKVLRQSDLVTADLS